MIEKIGHHSLFWQIFQKDNKKLYHQALRILLIGVSVAIPIIFGCWRYRTTSEPSPLADGIWIGFLSSFFSWGLLLSVTEIGKKIKYIVLPLIILGIPVHLLFFSYPFLFLLAVVLSEIYAIYSLFRITAK